MPIALPFPSLLASPNVKAAIRVIREGETWNSRNPGDEDDEKAFRVRYHPTIYPCLFDSFEDHPRTLEPLKDGSGRKSSAAGALQITMSTWDDMRARYDGIGPQFTPQEQLKCAVALMHAEGALEDVIAGRFEAFMPKLAKRWASLPGSPLHDGGRKLTYAHALATWQRFGGGELVVVGEAPPASYTQPAAPIEDRSRQARPEDVACINQPKEEPMGPAVLFVPLLQSLIEGFVDPLVRGKVGKVLDKQGVDPNPATAQIADNFMAIVKGLAAQAVPQTTITGAPAVAAATDPVVAVATVKADPKLLAMAEQQMGAVVDQMMPLLDRIDRLEQAGWAASEDSMDRAAARAANEKSDLAGPLALAAIGMVAVILLLLLVIMGVQAWKTGEPSVALMTMFGPLAAVAFEAFKGLYQYRFGTTRQSAAKDFAIAELSTRRKA
jgi:muramidase (phage lysozyme)